MSVGRGVTLLESFLFSSGTAAVFESLIKIHVCFLYAQSLQIHLSSTQGPIDVFICSDEPLPIEATGYSAADEGSGSRLNDSDSMLDLPFAAFAQSSRGESCI